jgi:predicted dehydrogenase
MPATPPRIALLGAGSRGRAVLPNWLNAGCTLAAVVDPSPDSLAAAKAAAGPRGINTQYVTDIQAWLKSADVDLVCINSWDPHHAQNAVDCFDAGLNLIVAKPMTQSLHDADRVYQAWQRSGKLGFVDMQIRTSSLVKQALKIINDGTIGQVKFIDVFDKVGFHGAFQRFSRSRRKDMIGSLTLAKGVHFLDLCNAFAGDAAPAKVFAFGGVDFFGGDMPNDLKCSDCTKAPECLYEGAKAHIGGQPFPSKSSLCVYASEVDVPDNIAASILYKNGIKVSYAESHGTTEYETTYDIIGTKGSLYVRYAMDNRLFLELRMIGQPTSTRIPVYVDGAHGGGDLQIVKDVVAAIQSNQQIQPSILAGRQAIALCEAIDQSIETGTVVNIPALPTNSTAPLPAISSANS